MRSGIFKLLNPCSVAILLILSFVPSQSPAQTRPTTQSIAWRDWSDDIFVQAKKENKFVLLDLHAVWCHWCHVMDKETYHDPKVIELINSKYIAVGVDADSRPDLANRYQDYGWPATIVFGPDGKEIVKRSGYIPPKPMASMLQAIIDDPTPGPSVVPQTTITYGRQTTLTAALRDELVRRYNTTYDPKFGGWGTIHKYLDWDSVEWALRQAADGNQSAANMARQTLDGERNLIDPVWGGVYQYSTDGDWSHPHFEKIMQFQAEDLRIYSLAYAQWHNPVDLKSAQDIHRYLVNFLLSPNGAFYTSQDADLVPGEHDAEYFQLNDAQRRAKGIPRIDQHQYSRENGWAISGLLALYDATGDRTALDQSLAAANWIIAHRSLPNGGFRHEDHDPAGPYLGDTLAMGRAFLALYESTADQSWLTRASTAADFIESHFVPANTPGIATADLHTPQPFKPEPDIDENIRATRWANLLSNYTGKKSEENLALTAMRYIATPQIAQSREIGVAGILLADSEISSPPLHITIVGPRDNPDAAALFATALAIPTSYKRVEWYDPKTGPLPNADVQYPSLPRPAAFVCTGSACSRPVSTSQDLLALLKRTH